MKSTNSYKNLSRIYDSTISVFWDNYWGIIKQFISPNQKYDVLDLGCGTGNAIPYLIPNLKSYLGIDISRYMLKIAQKQYPGFEFKYSSITNYKVKKQYNLIISAFDTINHLLSLKDWEDAFLLASNSLREGGYFIFDATTPYDHKFNWPNYHNIVDNDDLFLSQRGEYSKEGIAKLFSTFFCKNGKQGWVRYEDAVEQISFNSLEIRKMLSKVNLKLVAEIDIFTGKEPQRSSEVIVYICSKS